MADYETLKNGLEPIYEETIAASNGTAQSFTAPAGTALVQISFKAAASITFLGGVPTATDGQDYAIGRSEFPLKPQMLAKMRILTTASYRVTYWKHTL